MKKTTVLVPLLTLALAAGACGNSNSDKNKNSTGTTAKQSGAFTVPTTSCPPDATTKLAAGEPIKIGLSLPQSGPLAAFDAIRVGMKVAFDKQNAAGGVDGHQLQLVAKDDAYEPARSVVNVTEMIDKDKIFASVGQIGTPNVAASQKKHEDTCTPQLNVNTGFPAWGDPAHHPWTTGGILAYNTEATIWAEYIAKQKPDAKVALLIFNNDFGKAYQKVFTAEAAKKKLKIVATQLHEGTAPNIDNEVAALLAAKPDYVLGGTTSTFCSKLMAGLAKGNYTGKTIISSTCASAAAFFKPIDPAGDGVQVLTSVDDVSDPALADDPDVKAFKADVAKYGAGANANDTNVAAGWIQGLTAIEIFKNAANSHDGLTRASAMNAAWSLDFDAPLLFGPVKLDGTKDAYGVESLEFVKYSAAKHAMERTGEKFDRQGKTGVYTP
ncbi:MAG: branched-chain amino acid transport system substrate-binding protein [Actinomycetota bacterium]|jgi:ABC-type branched-subunit amino acid transport system substrate-binding protein